MRKKKKLLEEKKTEEEKRIERNKEKDKINNKEKIIEIKTLDKKQINEKEKEEIFKIDEKFIKKLHSENNIANFELQPLKEIVNDAYNFDGIINAFCVFTTIDNILYMVYTTRFKSIISFNISDDKKIKEVKNAHEDKITNFRH